MATTVTLKPISKWRISAESATAQGADGVQQLADTAYENLLSMKWERDDNEPTLPVHEYNRAKPYGQAYKAVWGYNAEARTERSCCGAVAYGFKLPDDTDGTSANDSHQAKIVSIKMKIAVDRYCDKGVTIAIQQKSQDARPMDASAALVYGDELNIFATETQLGTDGNPLPPNQRHGVVGEYTYSFPSPQYSENFLVVYLRLSDYTSVRGAWIEGGGMFAEDTIEVTFDRDVTPDETPSGGCPMDIGAQSKFGLSEGVSRSSTEIVQVFANLTPLVAFYNTYKIEIDNFSGRMNTILRTCHACFHISPSVIEGRNGEGEFGGRQIFYGLGDKGIVGIYNGNSSDNPASGWASVCVCHGLTNNAIYNSIRFANPIPIYGRVVIYSLQEPFSLLDSAKSFKYATPFLWWGDVLSEAFQNGTATTAHALTNLGNFISATESNQASMGDPLYTKANTQAFPINCVFVGDVDKNTKEISFAQGFKSNYLTTILIAVIPNEVTYSTWAGGQQKELALGTITLGI